MSIFGDVFGGIKGVLDTQAGAGFGLALGQRLFGGGGGGSGPVAMAPGGGIVQRHLPAPPMTTRVGRAPVQVAGFEELLPFSPDSLPLGGTGPGVVEPLFGLGEQALRGLLGGSATAAGSAVFFSTRGSRSVRPVHELTAVNPATGKINFWVHRGRPILYSGDLRSCKAVEKVARRAARTRPRRRAATTRRRR